MEFDLIILNICFIQYLGNDVGYCLVLKQMQIIVKIEEVEFGL